MSNCKDCRHYNCDEFRCENVGAMYVDPFENISPGNSDFAIAVVVDDDQGLDFGLKVGPLFGCVQFQGRTHA